MALILVLVAAVVIMAAYMNTQAGLVAALETDLPGYFKWAAAMIGVYAIGFIPGLQVVGNKLLALVFLVLVIANWQAILQGFQAAWQNSTQGAQAATGQAATTPAQQYAAAVGASGSTVTGAATGAGTGAGGFSLGQLGTAATNLTSSPLQTAESAVGMTSLLTGGLF